MPDALVSGLDPQQVQQVSTAYLDALGRAATRQNEQAAQQAESERQQANIAAQNLRQQDELKQQWAIHAMDSATKAEGVRSKNSQQYFTSQKNSYNTYLDQTERYWSDIAKNASKFDDGPNVQKGAEQNLAWARNKRAAVGQIDPASADPYQGIPALREQAPFNATPNFSKQYLNSEEAKMNNPILTGEHTQQLIDKGNNPAQSKDAVKFQSMQDKVAPIFNENMTARKAYDKAQADGAAYLKSKGIPFSEQALSSFQKAGGYDIDGAKKAMNKADGKWEATAYPLLRRLQDPNLVGSDMADFAKLHLSSYNNYNSFDDVKNGLTDMSKMDYSGNPAAWKTATDFYHILDGSKPVGIDGMTAPPVAPAGQSTPANNSQDDDAEDDDE